MFCDNYCIGLESLELWGGRGREEGGRVNVMDVKRTQS